MQLHCTNCGEPLRAENTDLAARVAKCAHCSSVISLARAADAPPVVEEVGDVPRPNGLQIEDDGSVARITRRWFSPAAFLLLFFTIAWDAFLVFWYSMTLFGDGPSGGLGLLFVIFPIAHVAVGVGLTYGVITAFVNRTAIEFDGQTLRVRHGPLPWVGNRDVSASEVKQLYCERRFGASDDDGRRSSFFNLQLVTRDNRKHTLLSSLTDPDVPRFVEQQVERWLGLPDERVAGEFRG